MLAERWAFAAPVADGNCLSVASNFDGLLSDLRLYTATAVDAAEEN